MPAVKTADTDTAAPVRQTADSLPANQPESGRAETVEPAYTTEPAAPAVDRRPAVNAEISVQPAAIDEQTPAKHPESLEMALPAIQMENEIVIEQNVAVIPDTEDQPEGPLPSDEILDGAEPNLEPEETEAETDEAENIDGQEVEQPEPEDETEGEGEDESEAEAAGEPAEGEETEETDFIAQSFDEAPEEPVAFTPETLASLANISFEAAPDELAEVFSLSDETIESSLAELLEPLEPEAAEAVPKLIGRMVEIAAKQTETTEISEENREELEQICRLLLETLDLPSDEALVSKFIQSILLEEINLLDLAKNFEDKDIGTHERKLMDYLIVRNLSLLASHHAPPQVLLGRYALNSSLFSSGLQPELA